MEMSRQNEDAGDSHPTDRNSNVSSLARKSTGPRTPAGKARSKYNAVKRGIFSKILLLPNESRSEFESLLNGLRTDLQPEGMFESILVEKLVSHLWRYRRLLIAENAEIQKRTAFPESPLEELDALMPHFVKREKRSNEAERVRLESLRHSIPDAPQLDRLLRYETSLERAFDRTLTQLERHQRMRLGQPIPPPIKLDISSE